MRKLLFLLLLSPLCSHAQIINTYAGTGTPGSTGDGGPALSAELNRPMGITVHAGKIYFTDYNVGVVRMIDLATTTITTVAGSADSTGYGGDGGPATSAYLKHPTGIAFDAAGNMYIADAGNNRVRKVDGSGHISTVAGTGASGYVGDGGLATSAVLNNPFGIAFDGVGNMYIADASNNVIRKVTPGDTISTFAGTGAGTYTGDGGAASAATLYQPHAIIFDASGNMVFTDAANNVMRKITMSTGTITTIAGTGSGGYGGDSGLATSALFRTPGGIAFDSHGNLAVADVGNSRIRQINMTTGIVVTICGDGSTAFYGDGMHADSAEVWNAASVAYDDTDNLYITDAGNARIREVTHVPDTTSDTSSAVHNVYANGNVSLYPNPAHEKVSIDASVTINGLSVTDMLGREINVSVNSSAKHAVINTAPLPAGVYFVRVNDTWVTKLLKE